MQMKMVLNCLNVPRAQWLGVAKRRVKSGNVWGKCKMLAAAFALSGCIHNPLPASDTRPVDVLRITAPDMGGEVNARLHHIRTLNAAGTRVEINTGTCLSACTFYLSMDDVCVTRDSRFGFHSPLHPISILTNPLLPIRYPGPNGDYTRQVMVDMFDHLPRLRAFVAEAVQSGYFSYLTGADVIAMGIEKC